MNILTLKHKTSKTSYNDLIDWLIKNNYLRVPIVVERGEFSVKGSIIDIYPSNQTHPIRIEYFEELIESIRSFDVNNQKSISPIIITDIMPAKNIPNFMAKASSNISTSDILIADIKKGEPIVHVNYGIGIFDGLKRLKINNIEGEYIKINYADNGVIYVPLSQINSIHKYIGSTNVQVSSLNSNKWQKEKKKAKKATESIAMELLELYRYREKKLGFAFSNDDVFEIDLKKGFPYQETEDQKKAINAVKKDMEQFKPMDRLICGDVGYGKTEVAIRAVFKASVDKKQSAIIAPTTILAEQHYHTFKNRLAPFGHKIELLSRLKSKEELKKSLYNLKNGLSDIAIGTHRLLQKDVQFSDLGLLIIDEEQRFGVKHKETIKQLKKNIDVLTMSATPIPRTLYLSLAGARDISVINTPPKERLPIKTILCEYNEAIIKNAILEELKREGQIFFVHNEVKTIASQADLLKKILPDLKIGIGHGQMPPQKLEAIMLDFLNKKYDLLICTTIIESGLDIANANTIIINKADRFGLSQLHQLRGRVGRSNFQAYAYLLYNSYELLSTDAKQRLQALKEYTALGSGYHIALRDMEIRGTGNILGSEQSGNINSIGFSLFCSLLNEAVSEAKGEIKPKLKEYFFKDKEYIPEAYIPDERQRLAIYKRLVNADKETLPLIIEELLDRFGKMPKQLESLISDIETQLN